jgi:hypothetical protein
MASTQQHNKEDNASLCSSPTADESSVATPISLDMNSYGSPSSSPSSSSNRSSPQSSQKEQLVFPPNYQSTNAVPSYFLCPISSSVMSDPVISPSGKTYERSTILRYLVLHEGRSPHGEYLELQDLVEDRIVKGAIEKVRKDAWVRYILDFEKKDSEGSGVSGLNSEEGTEDGKKRDHSNKQAKCSKDDSSPLQGRPKFDKRYSERITSESSSNVVPKKRVSSKRREEKHMTIPTNTEDGGAGLSRSQVSAPPLSPTMTPTTSSSNVIKTVPPPPPKTSNDSRSANTSRTRALSNLSNASATSGITSTAPSTPGTPNTAKQLTLVPSTVPRVVPGSNISTCSNISFSTLQHNGWAVQLGVHKVVCSSPGLCVTGDVHRRSTTVKRRFVDINGKINTKDLVIPPGSYVEVIETQVHGGRVRGRINWEEDESDLPSAKANKKKLSAKKRASRMLKRGRRNKKDEEDDGVKSVLFTGWISLQWAEDEEDNDITTDTRSKQGISNMDHKITDEGEGPWTEPVPLGVYRINFGAGLPLRETTERDSLVLDKLERGRCVEVVETQVKGDRVRARCIVPPMPGSDTGGRFQSGWISLLNAMTGASGAQPVPLGAYVAVAESGCAVTEGGRLDSKVKGSLAPGSCIEVVATRIEEGVVRGLIAAGGHVTLFVPSGRGGAATAGGKSQDGGKMFAMPVPLGTYQVIKNGLEVTTGISSLSPVSIKLKQEACAEIVETRVEDGRVRGRMSAVGYSGVSKEARGWINLFEPTCRWAKIVCFQGGRPIASR